MVKVKMRVQRARFLIHPSFRLVERGDVINVVYQSSGVGCLVSGVRIFFGVSASMASSWAET